MSNSDKKQKETANIIISPELAMRQMQALVPLIKRWSEDLNDWKEKLKKKQDLLRELYLTYQELSGLLVHPVEKALALDFANEPDLFSNIEGI